jgi:hypothetical protein
VVDVLGGSAAVLTAMPVPGKHCSAVESHPGLVRHLYEVAETDNGRLVEGDPLGPEDPVRGVKEVGLVIEEENQGSPG